jgi:hypothetical protein
LAFCFNFYNSIRVIIKITVCLEAGLIELSNYLMAKMLYLIRVNTAAFNILVIG